jgi:hypothetical protein
LAANYSQKNNRFDKDMAYVEQKLDARSNSFVSLDKETQEKQSYIQPTQSVSSASSQATAKIGK